MTTFDPNHFYYDPEGNKIDRLEWGRLMETERTVRREHVGEIEVWTVYLGFVCPSIPRTQLYGTTLIDGEVPTPVQGYDERMEAFVGHLIHVKAIEAGFHCSRCRFGKPHSG